MKKKFLWILFIFIVLAGCSSNTSSSKDYPTKNIEIVAPASPGGGWDLTARSVQKILQDNKS